MTNVQGRVVGSTAREKGSGILRMLVFVQEATLKGFKQSLHNLIFSFERSCWVKFEEWTGGGLSRPLKGYSDGVE